MPIFMDRHDVSEAVTAEHVAQLHQEDLKIQYKFGCRGMKYWFDCQRKMALCLIDRIYLLNVTTKCMGSCHLNQSGQT